MSRRVTHRHHPQRGTILGGGTAHVRMRPRGGLHEQRERDAQFGAAAYLRPDLPPQTAGQRRFQHDNAIGTSSRIRPDIGSFPPAWAASAVSRLKARSATRPTRVSSAAARQHHSNAVARSRRELKGSNTMAYQTVNPYDNHVVATFDDLTDEQAMELLGQAQKTFESWSQTSFAERTAVIKRSAAILRERSDEFARLLTLEMGKLYTEALGEVELSAQILDYYAEKSEGFLAPEPLETASADDTAMLVSAPLGVILGVQPWNFPYYQLARVAGPNLMAGNVVMVKHASNVPQAAAAFEKLLLEAGAPAGAYTNLYATKDQINLLIDDDRVRGVALTGSEGAGAVVAARAGRNLKKSTMELGGSDAFIALADCDLDKTVAVGGARPRFQRRPVLCGLEAHRRRRRDCRRVPGEVPGGDVRAEGRRSVRRFDDAGTDVQPEGCRRSQRTDQRRRRSRREGNPMRRVGAQQGCVHPADDPDRPHPGQPGLLRGVLRSGGAVLPGQGRGRSRAAGQRLTLRFGRIGVHQRRRAWHRGRQRASRPAW